MIEELDAASAALVRFAVETGLPTNEWAGLERRDIDRSGGVPVVSVHRRVVRGQMTPYPKTDQSRRRVPLTAAALAALDQLPPRLATPILFPAGKAARSGSITGGGASGTPRWRPPVSASAAHTTCATHSRPRRWLVVSRCSSRPA